MTASSRPAETVPGVIFDYARGPAPVSGDTVARPDLAAAVLPVADVSALPGSDAFWMSTVTVDADGRFAVRAAMRRLGWARGHVTVTADAASGVLTVSAGGSLRVTAKGMVRLPVAVRRACDLDAGARLLLVVSPDRDILFGFTAYAVERWWYGSCGDDPGDGAA